MVKVLDKGFVELVDSMGGDSDIADSARVSYGKGTKQVSKDEGLIRYLMRHQHSTPFEQVYIKFHIKLPIFVARQIIRHRTFSYNEISARYSILEDEFYIPDLKVIQSQSKDNKQGRGNSVDLATKETFLENLNKNNQSSYENYQESLNNGIARELSRISLPVNIYTEWYMSGNLFNWFKFLKLRQDPHAQYEIREYANAIYELIKPIAPLACGAYEDYMLEAKNFSKKELEIVRDILEEYMYEVGQQMVEQKIDNSDLSDREKKELYDKLGIKKEEHDD